MSFKFYKLKSSKGMIALPMVIMVTAAILISIYTSQKDIPLRNAIKIRKKQRAKIEIYQSLTEFSSRLSSVWLESNRKLCSSTHKKKQGYCCPVGSQTTKIFKISKIDGSIKGAFCFSENQLHLKSISKQEELEIKEIKSKTEQKYGYFKFDKRRKFWAILDNIKKTFYSLRLFSVSHANFTNLNLPPNPVPDDARSIKIYADYENVLENLNSYEFKIRKCEFFNNDLDCIQLKACTSNTCFTQKLSLKLPQSKSKIESFNLDNSGSAVDILLIIDDSGSMGDDQVRLANGISNFFTPLNKKNINWHLVLTTTNFFESRTPVHMDYCGYNHSGDKILKEFEDGIKVLTSEIPDYNKLFQETAKVGTSGSFKEDSISTAVLALLKGRDLVGKNEEFFRDNTDIVIFIITDEGEGRKRTRAFWLQEALNDLNARYPSESERNMYVYAIHRKDRDYYNRVSSAIEMTGGIRGAITDNDYSVTLGKIADNIISKVGGFVLTERPFPDSIVIEFLNSSGKVIKTLDKNDRTIGNKENGFLIFKDRVKINERTPPGTVKIRFIYNYTI